MGKRKHLTDLISKLEYTLARHKFVLDNYPDSTYNESGNYNTIYCSKQVNKTYTKFDFIKSYNTLYVVPYNELLFSYGDKEEVIKIYSSPQFNRLVYRHDNWRDRKKYIKFSRMTINFKNNEFKGDMLNSCRAQILEFIKNNPGSILIDTHLEPRLKKLLAFT